MSSIFSDKHIREVIANSRGFTLVEMLIVIAIIGILSLVSVTGFLQYAQFSESNRAVQSVLSSVKETQVWGTASREYPAGAGNFDSGFGVFFDMSAEYSVFVDDSKNNEYGGGDALVKEYTIEAGSRVSNICVQKSGNCVDVDEVSVVYRRPNLGPIINNDSGARKVEITITSPQDRESVLVISAVGEIYVQ